MIADVAERFFRHFALGCRQPVSGVALIHLSAGLSVARSFLFSSSLLFTAMSILFLKCCTSGQLHNVNIEYAVVSRLVHNQNLLDIQLVITCRVLII